MIRVVNKGKDVRPCNLLYHVMRVQNRLNKSAFKAVPRIIKMEAATVQGITYQFKYLYENKRL